MMINYFSTPSKIFLRGMIIKGLYGILTLTDILLKVQIKNQLHL